jgi:hypothetical protein
MAPASPLSGHQVSQLRPLVFLAARAIGLVICTQDTSSPPSLHLYTLAKLALLAVTEIILNVSWIGSCQITAILVAIALAWSNVLW